MITFEQAFADGTEALIAWLKASPNGGHNRLTPEEVVLVAGLMNTKLNDTEVMSVWIALERDVVHHIYKIHPLVQDRVLQAAEATRVPLTEEQIEANRRAAMAMTGHL